MPGQATPLRSTKAFDPADCFRVGAAPDPALRTRLGALYRGDCLKILPDLRAGAFDTVFADPPFNLGKDYGPHVSDGHPEEVYLSWSRQWLRECARVLRPGGSLFVHNLPKWNVLLGAFCHDLGLTFRHWIASENPVLSGPSSLVIPSPIRSMSWTCCPMTSLTN